MTDQQNISTLDKVIAYMTHYEYNIPVLQETYDKFKEEFKDEGFDIEFDEVERLIMKDPFLALKVLLKISHLKKTNLHADVDCIKKALQLLGTKNIFSLVLSSTVMIQNEWVDLAVKRATYASAISQRFSELRYDIRPTEVAMSTLLADLGELMMWTFKPSLALAVTQKMLSREYHRNYQAQLGVFGFRYSDLSYALARAWRLPEPLTNFLEHKERETQRTKLSHVCVDIARHVYGYKAFIELPADINKIKEAMEEDNNEEILNVLQLDKLLPAENYEFVINALNNKQSDSSSSITEA